MGAGEDIKWTLSFGENAIWQVAGSMLSYFLSHVYYASFLFIQINKQIREFKKPFQGHTVC